MDKVVEVEGDPEVEGVEVEVQSKVEGDPEVEVVEVEVQSKVEVEAP